jgi:predicted NBD/HSP70 family sugar kinase
MRISDQAYNRLKVLKAIRARAPISRTELTALTGFSSATITDVTADLTKRGLLIEERQVKSGRGRPRALLSIDPAGGIVIGATLLRTQMIRTSIVDLAGNLLQSGEAALGRPATLEAFAVKIAEILEQAIEDSAYGAAEISRVAISLPGLVDTINGVIHWITTYDEQPFPFAALISERLQVPVTIENDSTCLARAEHWFGKAQALDTFSLFRIGLWVDAAQYVDGLPRSGGNGFSSEIAHVKTDHSADARPCLCGSKGCLALYGSIFGVMVGSGTLGSFDAHTPYDFLPMYDELSRRAENGDPAATPLFDTAGEHLGIAIADHINAFDPGTVLVLASNLRFLKLVRPTLEQALAQNLFMPLGKKTRLEIGMVLDDWRWKGTAAHALEQTYLGGHAMRHPR